MVGPYIGYIHMIHWIKYAYSTGQLKYAHILIKRIYVRYVTEIRLYMHRAYGIQDRYVHTFLPREAMHKRGLGYAVMRCLCVCLFVTFVSCVKTNKHIFKIFSSSGSQVILVFPYQTGLRDGNIRTRTPSGGVKCRCGRQKLVSLRAVNAANAARCCQHAATEPWLVVTLPLVVAASFVVHGRRRRNVYDKKSQRYAKDNRTTFNCTQW